MSTQVLGRKLTKEIEGLRDDIGEVRKIILEPSRDTEGEYSAYFVQKMLARSQNRGPFHTFTDKESFLKHVRSKQ